MEKAVLFQTGWFAFGILSQTMIIHMIRTRKTPFIESKSSKELLLSTSIISIITLVISFTNLATIFDLSKLPAIYLLWMMLLIILYAFIIQVYKKVGTWW